jgi:hypothetical protein
MRRLFVTAASTVVASCALNAAEIVIASDSRLVAQCEATGYLDEGALARATTISRGCIRGKVYVDREFAVIVADGEVPAGEGTWDIVVMPATTPAELRAELSQLNGQDVVVVGELVPDRMCWYPELTAEGEETVCAPAKRPVELRRGSIVRVQGAK